MKCSHKCFGKLTIIGLILMFAGLGLFCKKSHATGYRNPLQPNMNQEQLQLQAQMLENNIGGLNNDIEFKNRVQIPHAPGLSSGSSNSSGQHRIYKQRQGSFILGGWTNIDMVLDLPAFIGSNPSADEQLAACVQDAGFREYRRLKGDPCPQ